MPLANLAARCLPLCLQNKDAAKLEELGGVEGLAKALHTSTDDGLDESAAGDLSVARRQELYGANVFASVPAQSFWAILWDALSDKVLIVLMVAATVRLCSASLSSAALHCAWQAVHMGKSCQLETLALHFWRKLARPCTLVLWQWKGS